MSSSQRTKLNSTQLTLPEFTQLNSTLLTDTHLISAQLNWLNTTRSSQLNSIQLESAHLNSRNWTQLA